MPANPIEAGRKGGRSRSAAKLAACKRNGFQKVQRETRAIEAEKFAAEILPEEQAAREQMKNAHA